MKRNIFTLLTISAILFACRKDNTSLQLTGKYQSDANGSIGEVFMYSGQGRVTDVAVIRNFLQMCENESAFIFDQNLYPVGDDGPLIFTIASDNKVTISSPIYPEPKHAEITGQSSASLLVSLIDSTHRFVSGNGRCEELYEAIKMVNPEKKYTWLSSTGYNSFYTFRPTFPIEIINGQLILPMTTFLVRPSEGNTFACLHRISNEWNIFNPAIINELTATDTIVYQTKRIKLIKQ